MCRDPQPWILREAPPAQAHGTRLPFLPGAEQEMPAQTHRASRGSCFPSLRLFAPLGFGPSARGITAGAETGDAPTQRSRFPR